MSVLATLGIVVGLAVIALMAVAPALVDLNERFPVREREESGAAQADRSRATARPPPGAARTPHPRRQLTFVAACWRAGHLSERMGHSLAAPARFCRCPGAWCPHDNHRPGHLA